MKSGKFTNILPNSACSFYYTHRQMCNFVGKEEKINPHFEKKNFWLIRWTLWIDYLGRKYQVKRVNWLTQPLKMKIKSDDQTVRPTFMGLVIQKCHSDHMLNLLHFIKFQKKIYTHFFTFLSNL